MVQIHSPRPFSPLDSKLYAFAMQLSPVEFVAHVAQLGLVSFSETSGKHEADAHLFRPFLSELHILS